MLGEIDDRLRGEFAQPAQDQSPATVALGCEVKATLTGQQKPTERLASTCEFARNARRDTDEVRPAPCRLVDERVGSHRTGLAAVLILPFGPNGGLRV